VSWFSDLWARLRGLAPAEAVEVVDTPPMPQPAPPADEHDTQPMRKLVPAPPLDAGMVSEHFSWGEFGCKDGTPVPPELRPNVIELCRHLETIRAELGGRAMRVISGFRTPEWNVGKGVSHSQHKVAKAADIRVRGVAPQVLQATILRLIAKERIPEGGIGLYLPRPELPPSAKYPKGRPERKVGWVHYDIRGRKARWTG